MLGTEDNFIGLNNLYVDVEKNPEVPFVNILDTDCSTDLLPRVAFLGILSKSEFSPPFKIDDAKLLKKHAENLEELELKNFSNLTADMVLEILDIFHDSKISYITLKGCSKVNDTVLQELLSETSETTQWYADVINNKKVILLSNMNNFNNPLDFYTSNTSSSNTPGMELYRN